jgi:hypothetical protein
MASAKKDCDRIDELEKRVKDLADTVAEIKELFYKINEVLEGDECEC